MTVIIMIGRRQPRQVFHRLRDKMRGWLSFQEQMWIMIINSMEQGRKAEMKLPEGQRCEVQHTQKREVEDMMYEIYWHIYTLTGTPEREQEEYDKAMKMYLPMKKWMKKSGVFDLEQNPSLSRMISSKVVPVNKIEDAYRNGYGAASDSTISNALLDLGIITHVELIKDAKSL